MYDSSSGSSLWSSQQDGSLCLLLYPFLFCECEVFRFLRVNGKKHIFLVSYMSYEVRPNSILFFQVSYLNYEVCEVPTRIIANYLSKHNQLSAVPSCLKYHHHSGVFWEQLIVEVLLVNSW